MLGTWWIQVIIPGYSSFPSVDVSVIEQQMDVKTGVTGSKDWSRASARGTLSLMKPGLHSEL